MSHPKLERRIKQVKSCSFPIYVTDNCISSRSTDDVHGVRSTEQGLILILILVPIGFASIVPITVVRFIQAFLLQCLNLCRTRLDSKRFDFKGKRLGISHLTATGFVRGSSTY
eukprot:gnl/MRDRNA2_/MRDRNA2_52709_c0_seq1.p1 gnl/MRDRNA2_/MRDRNA2_52709_c0~~gnl/MRDRNA2_/MRDRNA2_52709_c0_seq1.p1  ORF type:complete len:113 (-),score=0.53 gnl/MRDRNA2_/MRDRNA2_52709_c0_seq1:246-584(-)